jgi:hypothetical protein
VHRPQRLRLRGSSGPTRISLVTDCTAPSSPRNKLPPIRIERTVKHWLLGSRLFSNGRPHVAGRQ